MLPGFHGSAKLFSSLVKALGDAIDVHPLGFKSYDSLTEHADAISPLLPQEGSFLLAESFSGLIALQLAARQPGRFKGLILSATFAQSPFLALCKIGARLPTSCYKPNPVRQLILKHFCLNGIHNPSLEVEILQAVNEVEPTAVKKRFRVLASADLTGLLPTITTPVLILESSCDRIVPTSRIDALLAGLPNAQRRKISGPHLILQTKPLIAATAIKEFIRAN